MTLTPVPAYSNERTYLVKLHRDADPREGRLVGRLEHLASGERIDFVCGAALLAAMLRHAATEAMRAADEAAEGGRP